MDYFVVGYEGYVMEIRYSVRFGLVVSDLRGRGKRKMEVSLEFGYRRLMEFHGDENDENKN